MVSRSFYFGFAIVSAVCLFITGMVWQFKYKKIDNDTEPNKKKVWKNSLIACFVVFGVFCLVTAVAGFVSKSSEGKESQHSYLKRMYKMGKNVISGYLTSTPPLQSMQIPNLELQPQPQPQPQPQHQPQPHTIIYTHP